MKKTDKKYYCGPFWMPNFIKKVLSKRFNESCYIHDDDYYQKNMTRADADEKFLLNMINENGSNYLAIIYYLAVRLFGWISWKK